MSVIATIEEKVKAAIAKVEAEVTDVVKHGQVVLANDIKVAETEGKAKVLAAVENAAPEVKAAVQAAVAEAEQLILAAIELHLG